MITLADSTTFEATIRNSRFVAHAARVDNQADTLAFYQSVADPSATHNCWAWRLGEQVRFNDDGEPASTAGRPILASIDGKDLDHVMIVVTRYYGGTKLGVGGLIRAYGGTAARCLDRAEMLEIQPTRVCRLNAGFEWTGTIYQVLESCSAVKLEEQFRDDGVHIRVELPASEVAALEQRLRDRTRGEASLKLTA